MGNESSKANLRRRQEGYFDWVFAGRGIDIGCGDDPVTPDCFQWDLSNGDAQELPGLAPAQFDWVYSSHCLEHLSNPRQAILRWWEVLKPGGRLMVVVPDEDLYEQGVWPSRYNSGHKWTFTVSKDVSWSPNSINMVDLAAILPGRRVRWIRMLDTGYNYAGGIWDRTGGAAEAHVEMLVEKLIPETSSGSF